ncbi:MAG: pentapeptide repeat-containing protein, partial [Coleofasciculaceae cyanobacterium]
MTTPPDPQSSATVDNLNGAAPNKLAASTSKSSAQHHLTVLPLARRSHQVEQINSALAPITLVAIAILIIGITINNFWIGMSGAIVALLVSIPVVFPSLQQVLYEALSPLGRTRFVAVADILSALTNITTLTSVNKR